MKKNQTNQTFETKLTSLVERRRGARRASTSALRAPLAADDELLASEPSLCDRESQKKNQIQIDSSPIECRWIGGRRCVVIIWFFYFSLMAIDIRLRRPPIAAVRR